jgi:hypothetical protein
VSGTQIDVTSLMAMVTLPIARWNQILEVLGTQPWREVNPLIVDVHRQIQDAVNAQSGPQTPVESRLKQVNPST